MLLPPADASGRDVVGGLEVGVAWMWQAAVKWPGARWRAAMRFDGAVDAPVDAPADAPQFDAEPDVIVDTRSVDGLGSCGVDRDCPTVRPCA